MEIYPNLDTAEGLSREYGKIPVMSRAMADMTTPVNLFLAVKEKYPLCYLMESAETNQVYGRYSFVGYDVSTRITFKDGKLRIAQRNAADSETVTETETSDPFLILDKHIKRNISPILPSMPKFTCGLSGYFGYDTVRYAEPTVKDCPTDDLRTPEIDLVDCRRIIVFDHHKASVTLITNITGDWDDSLPLAEKYSNAENILKEMSETVNTAYPQKLYAYDKKFTISSLVSQELFTENVRRAKDYITNGDIFQVVLSRRVDISDPPDPVSVYRSLRSFEPSPYMYCFSFGDTAVVGSSPEKLVSVENGLVVTNPIAGTIRRGADAKEDANNERKLINDEKERAEHIMLVDLSRNDIGKICDFGTVNVDKFMEIGKYSKLMHIVSQVSGNLKKDLGLLSVLGAVLPAGTLSGAPKIRAMQIIDELEPAKRGLYGGAIGYIGYNGIMDMCIAIRTAFFKDGKAYIQSGAGIVADSDPLREFEESRTKSAAMLSAFEKAGEI
ncbi:anthranilate synthase component I [Clostridia bacterium]|nr:anthranilate synthase component I [Clostridia bacterium]